MGSVEAKAHYLFVHIGPPAEAGRAAEVFFSELAEAGDPRFIEKVAHTQLWLQSTPGQFQPLKVHKAADRLRAFVPVSGSIGVVGVCDYGVLARAKQPSFLLRHYPKALAGNPEELNRLQPFHKIPFEVVATLENDRVVLVALRDGKPVPGAVFYTVDASLHNEKLTAGSDGRAAWKPPAPGKYSVYTRQDRKEAGELRGKQYEEIREFATIAFTWPLIQKAADPVAVALFQEAVAARAQWKEFPGFTARIAGRVDGRPFEGKVTINAKGEVELETEEEVVQSWVEEQLASIVMHRGVEPQSEAATPPKLALRFAEAREDHPLGSLVLVDGGRFASSYRIKDKQIMVVNRYLGKQNLTISVLENERNREGRFLPRSYVVQYWDAATGDPRRTDTVQERWQRVGSWDLPTQHTVTTASDTGLTVRTFSLSEHRLLQPK
jgi:hypothetical protein